MNESRAAGKIALRRRLSAARGTLAAEARAALSQAISAHLNRALADRLGALEGRRIAAYWPIRSEPDLRPWLEKAHAAGAVLSLPVVAERDGPLQFKRWFPGQKMRQGAMKIPEPDTDELIRPEIVIAPALGWGQGRYRLGYGGGYYDRTLAAQMPRPLVIGISLDAGAVPALMPEDHDIPMDLIVTESGPK